MRGAEGGGRPILRVPYLAETGFGAGLPYCMENSRFIGISNLSIRKYNFLRNECDRNAKSSKISFLKKNVVFKGSANRQRL